MRHPNKVLQYLEMDGGSASAASHYSECLVYASQFYKQMSATGSNILAAGGSGGRNEIKFFESSSVSDD